MIRRALALAFVLAAATVTPGTATPPPPPRPVVEDAKWIDLGPLEVVVPVPPSPAPSPSRKPRSARVVASWYADKLRPAGAVYGAMHRYRWGDPVFHVSVCSFDGGTSRCVTVPIVDYCQCYVGTPDERGIDLSPAAFAQLAPLSRGLVMVTVEELE